MKDKIMVSICCLVYNHEKYLRKCLDGFLMQETDFKFEVLIHDDASTDHSQEIIREYEKKYPDIIKPIYQKENQKSQQIKISWVYQYPRAQGKYIALCEGDDFWTDKHKLQKQFKELERNSNAFFCTHIVRWVYEDERNLHKTTPLNIELPHYISSEKWIDLICNGGSPFQTSSYFFRAEVVKKYIDERPDFMYKARVGDVPLMLLIASEGDCVFIKEVMSNYRYNSIGSWSRKMNSSSFSQTHYKTLHQAFLSYDEFTKHRFTDSIQRYTLSLEFWENVNNNNYKKCFQKKYNTIMAKLPIKYKIGYFLFAFFPSLRKLHMKFRYRNT